MGVEPPRDEAQRSFDSVPRRATGAPSGGPPVERPRSPASISVVGGCCDRLRRGGWFRSPSGLPSPSHRLPSRSVLDSSCQATDSATARAKVLIEGHDLTGLERLCRYIARPAIAFAIDVLTCPHCGSPRRLIAQLTDPVVVRKILAHLGHPTEPPRPAPARSREQLDFA